MSRVVVVGGVLLDTDVEGTVDRVAPDAPAPVLQERSVTSRAGGAGLAATLLARDGHDVVLVTAVADDEGGRTLRDLLAKEGVELHAVPESGTTRQKRRLRAQGTSVARWDSGEVGELRVDAALLDALGGVLASADAVLCSDYGGPVLRHPQVRDALRQRPAGVPLVWDPHPRGDAPVAGATVVTPNLAEALAAAQASAAPAGAAAAVAEGDLGPAARAAGRLVVQWAAGAVVVTLSARGALCSTGAGAPLVVPARRVSGGDACGAGDRFAAALTAALAAGLVLSEALPVAVVSASAFVAAGGAAGLSGAYDEPEAEDLPGAAGHDALGLAEAVRARGGTVVATGGCFDLLHAGHVAYLQQAASLGDCLVVCLNSDDSVRRLKGPGRPLQAAEDRARVLAALDCVDAVLEFGESTPVEALRRLRPSVWVKGGDYAGVDLPEARVLAGWGGSVVVLPYLAGRSTSELVAAARAGGPPDPRPAGPDPGQETP